MQRFKLPLMFALIAWIALPLHGNSQEAIADALPAYAITRIGTTRYHVPPHRLDLVLSRDGKLLAVNNLIDGIDIWRLPAWTKVRAIRVDSIDPDVEARFACVAFTPDVKNLLFFNASTEQIVVFDIASGEVGRRIRMPRDGPFPDAMIATSDDAKTAALTWDDPRTGKKHYLSCNLETGKLLTTGKLAGDPRFKRLLCCHGTTLIASDESSLVRQFDLENGKEIPCQGDWPHNPLAFSADDQAIYFGDSDGLVVRHHANGKHVKIGREPPAVCTLNQLAFGPKQKLLSLGVNRNTVFLWETISGKLLSPIDVPSGAVTHLRFSSEGELFVGAANGHRAWWNAATGAKVRDDKQEGPADPERRNVSADGRWVAYRVEKDRLHIVRVEKRGGHPPAELHIPGHEFGEFAFSPDGRHIACSMVDPFRSPAAGPIVLFEMSSKQIRLKLPGHPSAAVERLAYAPDSAHLASSGADTMVYVWRIGLAAHVAYPPRPKASALQVAEWFKTMAGKDASAAFLSMIQLAEMPEQAIKVLGETIEPATRLDTQGRTTAQWVADLGNRNFSARARANALLLKLGRSAEPELRAALKNRPDLELKRRIELLLDRIAELTEFTPADIFHGRAVEVLEAIGTKDARSVLERWAAGDPGAVLTLDAQKAAARLNRRRKDS